MSNPRGLSTEFLDALENGILSKLRERIINDHTLDLQIRANQVHVYYRGGKIIGITMLPKIPIEFEFKFDSNYTKSEEIKGIITVLPPKVTSTEQTDCWIQMLPFLKNTMDLYFATLKETNEREFQQLFVRENNYSKIANGTDYFFVDMEYVHPTMPDTGRADLIAFKWRSNHERKKGQVSLAFLEVKYSYGAFDGKSGIAEHVHNMYELANNEKALDTTRKEMLNIFEQKRKLKLVRFGDGGNGNMVTDITHEKPEIILLLINHDPESSKLISALKTLQGDERECVKIATANFFGYGLYENCVISLDKFLERFETQIYSKECKK